MTGLPLSKVDDCVTRICAAKTKLVSYWLGSSVNSLLTLSDSGPTWPVRLSGGVYCLVLFPLPFPSFEQRRSTPTLERILSPLKMAPTATLSSEAPNSDSKLPIPVSTPNSLRDSCQPQPAHLPTTSSHILAFDPENSPNAPLRLPNLRLPLPHRLLLHHPPLPPRLRLRTISPVLRSASGPEGWPGLDDTTFE